MAKNSTANTYQDMAQARWSAVRDRADNQLRRVGMTQWNRDEEERKNRLNEFGNYLSSGNYTTENNQKFRDLATQAVADLDEQMKRYSKSSDEYKTLDSYKNYYSDSLGSFDRLDVGTNAIEYLGSNDWHDSATYETQRSALQNSIDGIQAEMDAIEDKASQDYKTLEGYRDWYQKLMDGTEDSWGLKQREEFDRKFKDVNDYVNWQNSGDYGRNVQIKTNMDAAQKDLDALLEAERGWERKNGGLYLNDMIAQDTSVQLPDGTTTDINDLRQQIADKREQLKVYASDLSGLKYWQDIAIGSNYNGGVFDSKQNYQNVVNELKAAREKATTDADREKIDAQIKYLAGDKEDGTNANDLYDESTLLGQYVLYNTKVEDVQRDIEKIDKELESLGVGVNAASIGLGVDAAGLQEDVGLDNDPHVMKLRAQRRQLQQKLNSAERFQEKQKMVDTLGGLSEEDQARFKAEGEKHVQLRDDGPVKGLDRWEKAGEYGPEESSLGDLKYFSYLDEDDPLRDQILMAIGAEWLGEDIGFAAQDFIDANEAAAAQRAALKDAKKIKEWDSKFGRAAYEAFAVPAMQGLNRFNSNLQSAVTGEYVPENRLTYLRGMTREDLGNFGDGRYFANGSQGGSNFLQLLSDATETTANMLPMILASKFVGAGLAAAGLGEVTIAGETVKLAEKAGKVLGAGIIGASSGGGAYNQALAEGWSKEDARLFGTIMGAAEAGTQYLIGGIGSLGGVTEEGLLAAAQGINNAALRAIAATNIHILSEVSEELVQNRIERALDYGIFGRGEGDFYNTWVKWDDDDWYTVVVTALSTGAMEGPGEVINAVRSKNLGNLASGSQQLTDKQIKGLQSAKLNRQSKQAKLVANYVGSLMKSSDALAHALPIIASDTSIMPEGTQANELATKMMNHKAPVNEMNLGNLFQYMMQEVGTGLDKEGRDKAYDNMMAWIIGGATEYNNLKRDEDALNAKKEQRARIMAENPGAEVLDENASELKALGVPTAALSESSVIVNKVLSGTELTEAEMDKLAGDSIAAKAMRALIGRQNDMLKANTSAESTREIVPHIIEDMRARKQQQRDFNRLSIVQAAINAANRVEVNRAAANADLQTAAHREGAAWTSEGSVVDNALNKTADVNWQTKNGGGQELVKASTVKELQKTDTDIAAIQEEIDWLKRSSYKDIANASLPGMEGNEESLGAIRDLQRQLNILNDRAAELAKIRFPSKEQRANLEEIRQKQAALKNEISAIGEHIKANLQEKAAVANEKGKAVGKAAQKTGKAPAVPAQTATGADADVANIPTLGEMTRAQFVQNYLERNPNATAEQANTKFDEYASMTGGIKKGNVENGQTADQNQERNDVGDRGDSSQNSLRRDRSEQEAERFRDEDLDELRTEPRGDNQQGNLAARVTKDASVVSGDKIDLIVDDYKDLPELTESLKRSGFSKITYILEGDIVNALGESVPAVYNDGELFLRLDYPMEGYDYVGTAEHERLHLMLDLMRAKFGEAERRAFVSSTLQQLLGEKEFRRAFSTYAEVYGPVYLQNGSSIEDVAHMICEEMLCDMVGGINNFDTDLGDYLEDAEGILEASKFNVVMQNLVDNPSADPGSVSMDEIDKNALPYGIPADTLISTQNVDNPSTQPADASQVSKFAFFGLAEALGFKVDQTGAKNKVYYLNDEDAKIGRNGFTQITVDMIKESPIGDLIRYSVDKGDITPGQAEQEYNLFASIASITDQTHDFYQAMQFMGSTIFTALKANSDTQYGTTYDFPSICTKTQAVINEMSAQMVARGRSLTETEIRQAYNDVFNDGNPVPCPECYVFSRWVGIGGLLDNIRSYQERFGKMSVDEVIAAYNEANKEVLAFAEENGLSKGRAKGSLASLLDKQYKSLEEDIQKRENQGEAVPNKDYEIRDKLAARMSTIRSLTWIDEVYFAGKEHKAGNVNPNFSVPINVLYDLNEGETFARDYKEAWAFRTTQGAGYGKAITPYAEAILGEGMLVTANTTKSIKAKAAGALNNPYQTERGRITDSSARGKNLKTARKKELNQLFIGGQRLQSTSDARFDNAVDYLLAALELQSMKGGAQVYTKVPGAVAFFNICKMCTNMSMMPKGGGLDASGNPVDTEVGGMALATMVMLRKQNEYAGSITIGVNDAHIRALMKQEFRDFIIPYHASGGKMSLIEYFRQVQDPDLKGTTIRSSDYTKTQSDKILSDELLRSYFGKTEQEIEDIHKFRDTRLWILTAGKSGTYYSDVLDPYAEGLTESQSNARTVLQELYASMQADGKWNGVQLAKGKVEHQIFPNEFWDTNSTYDTSSVNTQRYLDYCDALGFLHRFSGKTISKGQIIPVTGYDQNGNKVELTDLAYDRMETSSPSSGRP